MTTKTRELKIIDDHTGKELYFKVIGVWVSNKKRVGAAIASTHYSINEIYIGVDGNIHLGRKSLGPIVRTEDMIAREVKDLSGKFTLKLMTTKEIYDFLQQASKAS